MARFYNYNDKHDFTVPIEIETGFLEHGNVIYIQGTVHEDAKSNSSINLQTGPGTGYESDVAFHLTLRYEDKAHDIPGKPRSVVARNTWHDRRWGTEENEGVMPLTRGQDFEMVILTHESHFKVAINGVHFCNYNHRLPLTSVSHLTVIGCFDISNIQFHKGPGISPVPTEYGIIAPMIDPELPHVENIDGWLIPDRSLWIRATPHNDAKRFTFNLKTGETEYVLNFDVRIDVGSFDHVICLNTFNSGAWDDELRPDDFPFREGATFDLLLTCKVDEYKIYVDGRHLFTYPHRLPLSSVDVLTLDGDIHIHHVAIQ